jgi:hypothetical protein
LEASFLAFGLADHDDSDDGFSVPNVTRVLHSRCPRSAVVLFLRP